MMLYQHFVPVITVFSIGFRREHLSQVFLLNSDFPIGILEIWLRSRDHHEGKSF